YLAAFNHFYNTKREEFTKTKRTTINTPPDYMNPGFRDGKIEFESPDGGSDKREITTSPSLEGMKCLETAMKALDRSMKVHITLTKRRDNLITRLETPSQNNSITDEEDERRARAKAEAPARKPDSE